MLWRSDNAIVCGKHQNLCAEANYGYCMENGISLARRLTGGGTVFHDLGNINFTFIKTIHEGLEQAVNYRRFLEPIREALSSLGVQTDYSSRNDLLMDGKKISGNAEHVLQKKKRVLHHGTLLYDANLKSLKNGLRSDGAYKDKAVKSVRSDVTNIRNSPQQPNTDAFLAQLTSFFEIQKHTNRYVLSDAEEHEIASLVETKYSALHWILGYSPRYSAEKILHTQLGEIEIMVEVHGGYIQKLNVTMEGNRPSTFDTSAYLEKELNHAVSRLFAESLASHLELDSISPYILF